DPISRSRKKTVNGPRPPITCAAVRIRAFPTYAPLPWPVGESMSTVAAAAASAAERREDVGAAVALGSEGDALGVSDDDAIWVGAGGPWTTVMQAVWMMDAAPTSTTSARRGEA